MFMLPPFPFLFRLEPQYQDPVLHNQGGSSLLVKALETHPEVTASPAMVAMKRALGPLELELLLPMNHRVGAGNPIQVLRQCS